MFRPKAHPVLGRSGVPWLALGRRHMCSSGITRIKFKTCTSTNMLFMHKQKCDLSDRDEFETCSRISSGKRKLTLMYSKKMRTVLCRNQWSIINK